MSVSSVLTGRDESYEQEYGLRGGLGDGYGEDERDGGGEGDGEGEGVLTQSGRR